MKKMLLNFMFRVFLIFSIPFALIEITINSIHAFFREFKYRTRMEWIFIKNHIRYGLDADVVLAKKFLKELKEQSDE